MSNFLPQWLIDISSISSLISLVVTIFLFIEARKIQKSFLRRARLPTITNELSNVTSEISTSLKNWKISKKPTLENLAKARGLLENLKPKLPTDEQKNVHEVLNRMQPRKHLIMRSSLSDLNEDQAWNLYADLNTIVTKLEQLVNDSRWD